jgi:hypothetical protein
MVGTQRAATFGTIQNNYAHLRVKITVVRIMMARMDVRKRGMADGTVVAKDVPPDVDVSVKVQGSAKAK